MPFCAWRAAGLEEMQAPKVSKNLSEKSSYFLFFMHCTLQSIYVLFFISSHTVSNTHFGVVCSTCLWGRALWLKVYYRDPALEV